MRIGIKIRHIIIGSAVALLSGLPFATAAASSIGEFFEERDFAISVTGGFTVVQGPSELKGTLEKTEDIEDRIFLNSSVDLEVFRKKTDSEPGVFAWLDISPYLTFNNDEVLKFRELGMKLGLAVSLDPAEDEYFKYAFVGLKIGRAQLEPHQFLSTDGRKVIVVEAQTITTFGIYLKYFFEITNDFGMFLAVEAKYLFVDGTEFKSGGPAGGRRDEFFILQGKFGLGIYYTFL